MKKKFVQIAAIVLSTALLVMGGMTAAAASGASKVDDTIIRVGLSYNGYGSSVQDGANLENAVGAGYRFGYYDSVNRFVELAATSEKSISVVKTTNVGYSSAVSYYNYTEALAATSSVVVGCYHLQLPGSYSGFEAAQAAASQYNGGFVAYISGTYYARVGNYPTRAEAERAQRTLTAGTTIAGTSSYGVSVVVTGTNRIVFQYDDNGSGTGLGIQPNQTGAGVNYVTWFKGYKYYGGFRYERINGGSLTVVNMVRLGDYIKGVLPYEMSASWPLEALKAQAVAARTYTLSNLNSHSSNHFDLCNTDDCQVYQGLNRATSNSDAAVDGTANVVATYQGKYAGCYYYSSNGGASTDSSAVWGGNQSTYPYLVGVADPYEATVASMISNYNWSVSYTGAELAEVLGINSPIVAVSIAATTDLGLPKSLLFTDSAGKNYTLGAGTVRSRLSRLRSNNYSVSGGSSGGLSINGSTTVNSTDGLYAIDGSGNKVAISGSSYVITGSGISQIGTGSTGSGNSGVFTFTGSGWGHNVGMSQWGAYAMAKQGYTYDQILKFYYTGITVG